MGNWAPHLHWGFGEEHVLLPSLVLRSSFDFIVAALIIILICLLERVITLGLEERWAPQFCTRSRWRKALWRTCLFWMATLLRLCYMLAAMTFQLGIILVIATGLAFGQFLIECWKFEEDPPQFRHDDDECQISSLQPQRQCHPLASVTGNQRNRPRSRSKPQAMYIQPAHSNLARANAVALQMGIIKDDLHTEETMHQKAASAWDAGEGRARVQLLGRARTSVDKDEDSFLIGGSDSDSES